jgi:simple sugar transport system permease protein
VIAASAVERAVARLPYAARRTLVPLSASLFAVSLLLALLWLVLWLGGYDAGRALRALWEGSIGSWDALTSATLVRATPLIFTGLAVALAFRAGVWNIGAEGQLLVGAAVYTAVALAVGSTFQGLVILVALSLAAAAGATWAGIAAVLRERFGVLEVISTIMLNFVALHLVSWLVRGPLQEPSRVYPQSLAIPDALRLGRLVPGERLHIGILLVLLAAACLWWVLRYSAAGFRVRLVGASPSAARSAGLIDVARTTAGAFLVSGALAGLGGAIEVAGVTYALYENLSPGYGYTAIAVALLARLHPGLVIVTGILFGALESGALAMQRDAGVPSVVVTMLEALLILGLLALERVRGLRGGWIGAERSGGVGGGGGGGGGGLHTESR